MMAKSADAGSTRTPFGIDLAVGSVVVLAVSVVAVVLFPEVAARLVVLTVPLVVYAAAVDDPRAGLATGALGYLEVHCVPWDRQVGDSTNTGYLGSGSGNGRFRNG